jgi:hypothetical protein
MNSATVWRMVLIFFNLPTGSVRYVPEYKWQQDHSILGIAFHHDSALRTYIAVSNSFHCLVLYGFSWTSLTWLTVLHCFIADEEMFSRNEQYAEPKLLGG